MRNLSRPEISLHLDDLLWALQSEQQLSVHNVYYILSFKLAVIEQVEKGNMIDKQAQYHYGIQGKTTVLVWLRRYGKLDGSPQGAYAMSRTKETPAQKINGINISKTFRLFAITRQA